MESTCKGENCWLFLLIKELIGDKFKISFEDCPFYVEMLWTPSQIGEKAQEAKLVKDCSNKRSLLTLLNDIHPRLTGVQSAFEQQRNTNKKAGEMFQELINLASERRFLK